MQCPKCKYEPTMVEMQRSPDDCVSCGVNYQGHARHVEQKRIEAEEKKSQLKIAPAVQAVMWDYGGAQPVVVVDVKMGFFSMVVFMVKWVLASIPAAIILALLAGVAYALISAVPQYFYYKERAEAAQEKPQSSYQPAVSEDNRITTAADDPISYFDAGLIAGDNAAVLTVKAVGKTGVTKYSRLGVDCGTALAVVSAQANSINEALAQPMPKDYERVTRYTTRWHIAKYACSKSSVLSPLLK